MSALDGIRRFRQYIQPAQRRAFDQAMESATNTMPPPADEGEDPDAGGEEGGHHIHVHIPPPNGGNTGTGGEPAPGETDQLGGEGGNNPEMEEIWQAIENLERAVVTGNSGDGFRDAWPHRDARRAKFGGDRRAGDEDEDRNAGDARGGDQGGEAAPTASNKTLIKAFEMEAPPGAAADLRRSHDSRLLQDGMQQLMADVEILVPGYRFPAFDARQAPARTVDQMCRLRRHAIELAYNQPDGRSLIERATRGRFQGSTRSMDCVAVRQVFDHLVDLRRTENNTGPGVGFVREAPEAGFGGVNAGRFSTPADMQKAMDEYYTQNRTH